MKTIAQVISAIRKGGFKVASRESTWAESKWWLTKKDGQATEQDISEIWDYMRFTAKRKARVELQTEARDGFSGIFLGFPKNAKAQRLVEAGIDPGDLENSV